MLNRYVDASLLSWSLCVGAGEGGLLQKVPAARENLEPENIGAMIVD